jgi:hypothetical protein
VLELWGLYITAIGAKGAERSTPRDSTSHDGADDFSRMFPLSPPPEDGTPPRTKVDRQDKRDEKFRSNFEELRKYPALIISPLFSYLAMIILKLPVAISDIYLYFLPARLTQMVED